MSKESPPTSNPSKPKEWLPIDLLVLDKKQPTPDREVLSNKMQATDLSIPKSNHTDPLLQVSNKSNKFNKSTESPFNTEEDPPLTKPKSTTDPPTLVRRPPTTNSEVLTKPTKEPSPPTTSLQLDMSLSKELLTDLSNSSNNMAREIISTKLNTAEKTMVKESRENTVL